MKGYELYHKVTGRSYKAYLADRAKRARVVDYDKWIKNPRLYDAEGIDTYANIFKYVRKGNKKRKRRTAKLKAYACEGPSGRGASRAWSLIA